MKRSDEKFGKSTESRGEEIVTRKSVKSLSAFILILILASCEKEPWYGNDGRPGDAYIALTWQVEEPTYVDAGTYAIPPVFYYGEYYRINPGYYDLYYEGRTWNGMGWAFYAWEVEYTIRVIDGEPGGWHYNGADGPDNYFTIEMSPYGPYISSDYKSSEISEKYELISDTGDEIVIKQVLEGLEMEVTYHKAVVKSERATTNVK